MEITLKPSKNLAIANEQESYSNHTLMPQGCGKSRIANEQESYGNHTLMPQGCGKSRIANEQESYDNHTLMPQGCGKSRIANEQESYDNEKKEQAMNSIVRIRYEQGLVQHIQKLLLSEKHFDEIRAMLTMLRESWERSALLQVIECDFSVQDFYKRFDKKVFHLMISFPQGQTYKSILQTLKEAFEALDRFLQLRLGFASDVLLSIYPLSSQPSKQQHFEDTLEYAAL